VGNKKVERREKGEGMGGKEEGKGNSGQRKNGREEENILILNQHKS